MSTITQTQCDIKDCSDNAAFTGVESSVKDATGQSLITKKMDMCTKHKLELLKLTPLTSNSTNSFTFAYTNATR